MEIGVRKWQEDRKRNQNIIQNKKILPIYIDLSQCKEMFLQNCENLEHSFIVKIVEEIKNQLEIIFQLTKFKVGKKDFSKLEEFDSFSEAIKEGILLKVEKRNITQERKNSTAEKIEGSVSLKDAVVKGNRNIIDEKNINYELDEARGYNVQQFLGCLGKIRQRSGLDAIYIFVDEFSDLTDDEQEKFSNLLKKLLGSKNNVFFKVGTITDRFYFGKDIIIGRDIYPIYLDLSDFVERYGGIVAASKELINYTEKLLQKRLESFAGELTMNDIFKGNKSEILRRISREAMGVPRTIGLILQNALTQEEVRNEKFIQLSDINVGIRETRKIYFKQFQGAVQKKVIPGFYKSMFDTIHHIAIIGSDYDKSKHFYVDLLGFEIIRENYRKERDDYKIDLACGEQEIELFIIKDAPARVNYPEALGLRHLAFKVKSVADTVKELNAKGIATESVRLDDYTGKKMTFFHDPDGLPLEIHE